MEFNNKDCYIIKLNDKLLYKFLCEDSSNIIYQLWEKDRWSEKKLLTNSCKEVFYPCISKDNTLQVFYVDKNNSIVLSVLKENEWKEKVLLPGNSKDTDLNIIFFKVVFQEKDIHIFYVLENLKSKETVLVHQSSLEALYWNSPKILDLITISQNYPFHICLDNKNNLLIFYQNHKNQHYFGYRRYFKSSNMWSEFYIIDKASSPFLDFSVIIKDNLIYTVYIEDLTHYSSLKLRCRNSSWQPAITIVEKAKINSCLLSLIDTELWIYWIWENKLFSTFTADKGENFSSIASKDYKEKVEIIKASYEKSYKDTEKVSCFLSQHVYINRLETSNLFTVEEFCPDILSDMSLDCTDKEYDTSSNINLDDIKVQIDDVYKKIYLCKKQISDKDYQISQLSFALDQKNREVSKLEYELQKSIEEKSNYAAEIKSIKSKNSSLEESLKAKERELNSLKNKSKLSEDGKNKLEFKIADLNEQLLQLKSSLDNIESNKKPKKSFLSRFLGDYE